MGHLLTGHARPRAEPSRDPAGARGAPARAAAPTFAGRELRVAPAASFCRSSWRFTRRAARGRQTIESSDLFSADLRGKRRACRSPSSVATASSPRCSSPRIATRMRDNELREERLQKRFELPPFLEALRDQPESARAPGQDRAGLRPRPGDSAGPRDPLPPRARRTP